MSSDHMDLTNFQWDWILSWRRDIVIPRKWLVLGVLVSMIKNVLPFLKILDKWPALPPLSTMFSICWWWASSSFMVHLMFWKFMYINIQYISLLINSNHLNFFSSIYFFFSWELVIFTRCYFFVDISATGVSLPASIILIHEWNWYDKKTRTKQSMSYYLFYLLLNFMHSDDIVENLKDKLVPVHTVQLCH